MTTSRSSSSTTRASSTTGEDAAHLPPGVDAGRPGAELEGGKEAGLDMDRDDHGVKVEDGVPLVGLTGPSDPTS